jgi:hypothetical protein
MRLLLLFMWLPHSLLKLRMPVRKSNLQMLRENRTLSKRDYLGATMAIMTIMATIVRTVWIRISQHVTGNVVTAADALTR